MEDCSFVGDPSPVPDYGSNILSNRAEIARENIRRKFGLDILRKRADNINENTINTHLYRARQKIKTNYGGNEYE